MQYALFSQYLCKSGLAVLSDQETQGVMSFLFLNLWTFDENFSMLPQIEWKEDSSF